MANENNENPGALKQSVGPIAIVIAVVALLGFMYYMYKTTQPDLQAAPDPRNGPPAYMKQREQGGAPAMQVPGQKPGDAPAGGKPQ